MRTSTWVSIAIVFAVMTFAVLERVGAINLFSPATDAASATTSSASGLEFIDGDLTFLQGCADSEFAAWVESTDTWDCTASSGVSLVDPGSDGDTAGVTGNASGLEFIGGSLALLRSCIDDQILDWDEASDKWGCTTPASGGGSNTALDLGDDDANESAAITEIAVTGDTNAIFTESAADKLLIAAANNWPSADTADALSADGSDCAANEAARGVTAAGAGEECQTLDGDGLTVSAGTLSADLGTAIDTGEITDGTILEADLNAVDAAGDEECLTSEGTGFEWETCVKVESQNLFSTITDGTAIIADSTTDTLTIATSGAAVDTQFNAGTDTITIEVDPAELFVEKAAVFVGINDVSTDMDIEAIRLYNSFASSGTIQGASCSVGTAPTTSAVTVDINVDGTTIYGTQGNRPSIAAGGFFDAAEANSVTDFAPGSYLSIDIDATDSGDTAFDLTCQVRIRFRIFDSNS